MGSATIGNSLEVTAAVSVPAQEPSTSDSALSEPDLAALLADLDHPRLVLSDGYVGADRRSVGPWHRIRRATFGRNRRLLRLVILVAAVATSSLVGTVVLQDSIDGQLRSTARATAPPSRIIGRAAALATTAPATAPSTTHAVSNAASPVPSTGVPAPVPTVTVPTSVAPPTTLAVPVTSASMTPEQLGAEALSLVRYPWQSIPGYSIQFLSIEDAPSAGFLGNTTFTWGRSGGVSSLYVYPGESVEKLAGIIAFEIGHEVDAAAVEPLGGEAAIETILGIHPASWAPNCDCSEQDFLSGWYAAAFSNYWSPGVGNWSNLAPEPSGAELAAVLPWLNPTLP